MSLCLGQDVSQWSRVNCYFSGLGGAKKLWGNFFCTRSSLKLLFFFRGVQTIASAEALKWQTPPLLNQASSSLAFLEQFSLKALLVKASTYFDGVSGQCQELKGEKRLCSIFLRKTVTKLSPMKCLQGLESKPCFLRTIFLENIWRK